MLLAPGRHVDQPGPSPFPLLLLLQDGAIPGTSLDGLASALLPQPLLLKHHNTARLVDLTRSTASNAGDESREQEWRGAGPGGLHEQFTAIAFLMVVFSSR